jgi:hypothetical protein
MSSDTCWNIAVVIKRLDDVSDDVRRAAIMTLVKIFKPLPPDYCMEVSYGHLEFLFGTMLIHLDDPDPGFQHTVLGMKLVHNISMTISISIVLDISGHNYVLRNFMVDCL